MLYNSNLAREYFILHKKHTFAWAGAAVKRLAEFAEKSKFELIGDPVEMKQAMKDLTYTQCENLARAMADRLKKDR